MTSAGKDIAHRFLFDQTDIRGEIVTVEDSLKELTAFKQYPGYVQQLLGEFIVAATLLATTLKFDGLMTLQARGNGTIPIIMVEINHLHQFRAIAKLSKEAYGIDKSSLNLPKLIGEGVLSITIDPKQGRRYQGIVPLDAPSLADCLEHYFEQSEQLPTKLWLMSDGSRASGLLLQQLPQQVATHKVNRQAWENRVQLANTVTPEELLNLEHMTLLNRLFHEEGVRVFDPGQLSFRCSCSKERSSQALKYLGQADVELLLQEQGLINIDCEFCGYKYTYDDQDVRLLFAPETRH